MQNWHVFLTLFALLNFGLFIKAYRECKNKKNAFGLTKLLSPLGMFVWGDVVVFSLFWTIASLVSVFLNDWILFLLIVSLFWVVRSLGETIYWFNQQFSDVLREPPHKVMYYSVFQNNSVWFVQQIIWQCVTVISLVFSIYFVILWAASRF